MVTRGLINDVKLKKGDKIKLEYSVTMTNGGTPLKDQFNPIQTVNLEVFNKAKLCFSLAMGLFMALLTIIYV